MVNGPAFVAPDAAQFLGALKLLAATTDRAEAVKKVFSAVARGAEAALEALGGKSATLLTMGGQPQTHILGDTFYTQAPILYGDYVAKVSVAPLFNLASLTGQKLDPDGGPDALRESVRRYFLTQAGEWEVRVQLCANLATMPIEDASVVWPEDESPYLPVARIVVPAQDSVECRECGLDRGGHGVRALAWDCRASAAGFGDAGAAGDLCAFGGVSAGAWRMSAGVRAVSGVRLIAALGLAALAGCSVAREPMVDRSGVSDAAYNRDLAACRSQTVSPVGFTNPIADCMTGKGYRVLMRK